MAKRNKLSICSLLLILMITLLSACGGANVSEPTKEKTDPKTEGSTSAAVKPANAETTVPVTTKASADLKTAAVGNWLLDTSTNTDDYTTFAGLELKADGTGTYGYWQEEYPLTWKIEKKELVLDLGTATIVTHGTRFTYDEAADTLIAIDAKFSDTKSFVYIRREKAVSYAGLASASAKDQEVLSALTEWREGTVYDLGSKGFGEGRFTLGADAVTIDGRQFRYYVWAEDYGDYHEIIVRTEPEGKDSWCINISEDRRSNGLSVHYAYLSREICCVSGLRDWPSSYTSVGYVCTDEITLVDLTADNWKDYFVMDHEPVLYSSYVNLDYDYFVTPVDENMKILDLSAKLEFEGSDYVNRYIILDQDAKEWYLMDYYGDSKYTGETKKNFSVSLYSFTFEKDRAERRGAVSSENVRSEKQIGNLLVQGIAYPTTLTVTKAEGYLFVLGKIDTSSAEAKRADIAAREEKLEASKEAGRKILYADATAIDGDGYGVCAYHDMTYEDGLAIYYRLHYDVFTRDVKAAELVYCLPKPAYSFESYQGIKVSDMETFKNAINLDSYVRMETVDHDTNFELIYYVFKPSSSYCRSKLSEAKMDFYLNDFDQTILAYKELGFTPVDATTLEPLK